MRRSLPDSVYPLGFFATIIVIVALLLAVGDGRGPNTYIEEVRAARYLLTEERKTQDPEQVEGIESALRSLDPYAVEWAEQTPKEDTYGK